MEVNEPITTLLDKQREMRDMVLYYQNRVLRLDIAIAELLEAERIEEEEEETPTPPIPPAVPQGKIVCEGFITPVATNTRDRIREVFGSMNGDTLTAKEVIQQIQHRYPRARIWPKSITSTLATLANNGEIQRVRHGAYCNISGGQAAASNSTNFPDSLNKHRKPSLPPV